MTYRTAIVGTGGIANVHARAVGAAGDRARLVAAVDVNVEAARGFARTWDVPRTYPGLDELLAGEQVDLVHLCTPPHQHASLALRCLDAGVSVTLQDARPTMEFIAALYASAFTGQTIQCGQIGAGSPFAVGMNGTGAPWEEVGVA